MDVKKLNHSALDGVSGGNAEVITENGKMIFKNVCTECGKAWEYTTEEGATAIPNWATGPWCPECRKKQSEEYSKKSESQK